MNPTRSLRLALAPDNCQVRTASPHHDRCCLFELPCLPGRWCGKVETLSPLDLPISEPLIEVQPHTSIAGELELKFTGVRRAVQISGDIKRKSGSKPPYHRLQQNTVLENTPG